MRTKLQIIDDLCKYDLRHYLGIFLEKNLIEFIYRKDETIKKLDIYLRKEDKKLHIYHIQEWLYERYGFENEDKDFGYLIEGPWIKIIDDLFIGFEQEIVKKLLELDKEKKEKPQQKEQEKENIEYFKNLF